MTAAIGGGGRKAGGGSLEAGGRIAGVLAFYLAATVVFTWPLASSPFARLWAPVGPGDPYLNLWILGWDLGAISRDPLSLFNGGVFDANIFFPAIGTLTFSDHLLLQAVLIAPAWMVTHHLVFCYNLLFFASLLGGALAMFALARRVTGSTAGALLAGLAWGFFPFRFAHLLHLQLQSLYFLPLAFLFLHRVMAGRRRTDAVWLGVFAALQAISSVYWGVVGALAIVCAAAGLAVGIGRWRHPLVWRRLALAGLVGGLLVLPVAWPYWQSQRREGFSRNLYEASQHEAVGGSYLRVPPGNLLYGRTGLLRPAAEGGGDRHEGPEQELFPGFVLIVLGAFGAWRAWRGDAKPLALAMLLVIAAGFVLSLGPGGVRWLYAAAYQFVFGFQAIRAPARFGVLVVFGLSLLAAVGFRELLAARAGRTRQVLAGAVPALLVVEFLNVPLPSVPAPGLVTPAGQWLAAAEGPGAVVYLPLDGDVGNTRAMLDSLQHRRPVVNGYSGQRPAFFMGLVDALSRLPAPDALWSLRDLNVRFVVSPRPLPDVEAGGGDGDAAFPLAERARFADAVVYESRWTPEAEAAFPRPEPPPPPQPGPLPFAASERAVYQVVWLGGAALSAGEVTLTATRAGPGQPGGADAGGWHLAVELRTAPWVSRFFEARDRLETWANAGLFPLRHEQHLREGRRVVDRVTVFDHERRVLRSGEGPALPLPPGGRDALSAFFYARALPLAPGYAARFPVTEGGRTYDVTLRVGAPEQVVVAGRAWEALRVQPRFTTSGGRQRALTVSLLVSHDARRVPLVFLVEAGFGSFRAELVQFDAR